VAVKVLVEPEVLALTVERLAAEISEEHPDGVLLVAVLNGSVVLLADLVRALTVPVEIDFIAISHYAPDSGRVRIVKDIDVDIAGRDVVIVEDIVDTGLTLTYLLNQLRARDPRRVEVCALLDRARRRIVPLTVRFAGIPIDDEFVLGYGLDFAQRYRNLRGLVAGDLRDLQKDPDAYVAELYVGPSA
jgi:hypoxanthine phosphoribosyltransferase